MIRSRYCMSYISSSESSVPHDRKRLTSSIKQSLRALSIQLSLLNHQVSERLGLNDVDLDCLDLISRLGPLSRTVGGVSGMSSGAE